MDGLWVDIQVHQEARLQRGAWGRPLRADLAAQRPSEDIAGRRHAALPASRAHSQESIRSTSEQIQGKENPMRIRAQASLAAMCSCTPWFNRPG